MHYHKAGESLALRITRAIEYARGAVAPYFGGLYLDLQVYLYGSDQEMADGLTRTLGYRPWEIQSLLKVGISAASRGTLHIHERMGRFGPFLTHALVDEYTHGVIEERFGDRPAVLATWLEEGLTSWIAHQVLIHEQEEFEEWYLEWSEKVAFKSVLLGNFPSFSEISERKRWYSNIIRSRHHWNTQYAAAFMGVLYIVETFGKESVQAILRGIQGDMEWQAALESVTGLAPWQFDVLVQLWILEKGVFHLYPFFSFLIVALPTFFIIIFLLYRRREKAGRASAPDSRPT